MAFEGKALTMGTKSGSAVTPKIVLNAKDGSSEFAGNVTADGESKFAKDNSNVYSLDVTTDGVTANKVVNAKAGIKFGADTTAMTSVERGAVEAKAVDGSDVVLISKSSLQATRSDMEADNATVFGGIYAVDTTNKTLSYNSSALTNEMFKSKVGESWTGASDLTGSLNNLALNMNAITGGSMTNSGVVNNAYNASGVSYDGLASSTPLSTAVSQVSLNIGNAIDPVARTKGRTLATNSVNSNIDALDEAIGTDLTTGTQNTLSVTQTVNQNLKALSNAISGSGSDVVHKSGDENITGTKTFKIVQKFEKTEGEGESAKTYETDIDGKTLTMGTKSGSTVTPKIVLNANDGSATFAGLLNANGGVNTTTLVVTNGANISGAAQFNDGVIIGSSASGGARSLMVNGAMGVTGLSTLSGTNGIKFDNADTTIKGFATTVDANSDNTTVATSKAVYDAIYGEGADVVHKNGIETITGIKTFTKQLTAGGGIYVDGASVLNGTMQVNDIATFSKDNGLRFGNSQIIAKDIVNEIDTTASESDLKSQLVTAYAVKDITDGINGKIDTEAAERRAEDVSLSNRINTEAAERRAEDASLSNRINTEAAERRAEDAALSRRIAETGAAVEQEAATRAAADTALDVRVTALEEESGGQSEAIRELQRDVKVQEVDGGLIRTQGNFVDGLAHTVGENVMILDDAMGSVDADGHYTKASKDADGKIVTTMADNIEKLDEHLHNASEALGGSFDETTDKWSANLEVATGKDAVKYGNITVEKVTDALNQIITNVGTKDDLGEEFNGIKTSNSLNKNIAALNDTIGNLKNMNDSTNITNGNPGSPGYKVPKNVVDVLNNIDATLGTVHGLSDKLRKAGKYNGNLGNETVESHLAAIDTSIGNRANMNNTSFDSYASLSGKDIASAVSSVASNVGTAADLGKAMNGVSAKNTVNSNIASLNMAIGNFSLIHRLQILDLKKTVYASEATNVTDAICALDSNMYKLDYQVNDLGVKYQRLRRELRIGMSSLAAMSAMAPNARAAGNTQLTIGTGAYADHTAVAVGAFHWITNNLMVNAGVAWGDTDDAIYRMGLSYSF